MRNLLVFLTLVFCGTALADNSFLYLSKNGTTGKNKELTAPLTPSSFISIDNEGKFSTSNAAEFRDLIGDSETFDLSMDHTFTGNNTFNGTVFFNKDTYLNATSYFATLYGLSAEIGLYTGWPGLDTKTGSLFTLLGESLNWGNRTLSGNWTAEDNLTVEGDFDAQGDVILGGGSGNTVNITAGTINAPNAVSTNATDVANVGALDGRYGQIIPFLETFQQFWGNSPAISSNTTGTASITNAVGRMIIMSTGSTANSTSYVRFLSGSYDPQRFAGYNASWGQPTGIGLGKPHIFTCRFSLESMSANGTARIMFLHDRFNSPFDDTRRWAGIEANGYAVTPLYMDKSPTGSVVLPTYKIHTLRIVSDGSGVQWFIDGNKFGEWIGSQSGAIPVSDSMTEISFGITNRQDTIDNKIRIIPPVNFYSPEGN